LSKYFAIAEISSTFAARVSFFVFSNSMQSISDLDVCVICYCIIVATNL